jgi:hypothetical protein
MLVTDVGLIHRHGANETKATPPVNALVIKYLIELSCVTNRGPHFT